MTMDDGGISRDDGVVSPCEQLTDAQRMLLAAARIAHLATADGSGSPQCVPVVFVWDGETLLVPLDDKPKRVGVQRLKRVRNIQENPHVAFLIDHYEEDWHNLWFIMLRGRAEIAEVDERIQLLFRDKYPQYHKTRLYGVLRIRVDSVHLWQSTPGNPRQS